MSFTRYNYDACRTKKKLQESTDPGRYILNVPGNGVKPCFFVDPHIRQQRWGGNLMQVHRGHPIDIDSDLIGITRKLSKNCKFRDYPNNGVVNAEQIKYDSCSMGINETRATHPSWLYKDLEQTRRYPLLLDPQENVCKHFQNNLNTRLLEKDNHKPHIPCSWNN